jgi:hypothetical protein
VKARSAESGPLLPHSHTNPVRKYRTNQHGTTRVIQILFTVLPPNLSCLGHKITKIWEKEDSTRTNHPYLELN